MSDEFKPGGPLLVLDAASTHCFVGIWDNKQWTATATPEAAALEGLFVGVNDCLCDAKLGLSEIAGFVHNEGPGSILGIRLSAMAIRTWRALPQWASAPVWAYRSLPFAAQAYTAGTGENAVSACSEFRHGKWNLCRAGSQEIVAVDDESLASTPAPLIHVRQRKAWKPPPKHAITWSPDYAQHGAALFGGGLLRRVDQPGVFVAEEATFAKWNAERHR